MRRLPRFLINRDYALLWSGQAVSSVGDFVFDTTLVIWIATDLLRGSHWAPAAVSALTLCVLLATVVVGPIAGVFVDRWAHRSTMLGSEVLRGVVVGALTLVTLVPRHDLPTGVWLTLLFVVVFVVNSARQFFNPARFAVIGDVVPGEADRARAFGLGQATLSTAAIIGPPLAAPLLVTAGIQWAMLINTLSYVFSWYVIRAVRFPQRSDDDAAPAAATGVAKPGWRTEFVAGLRMFAHNRFLVTILAIAVTAQLGTGAISALSVFFLTDNLHAGTRLLGVLEMGFGAGAIVGALIAGRLVAWLSARRVVWACMVVSGVLFGLYTRQTSFVPGLAIGAAFFIPLTALNTAASPLLLAATPKGYLGRMMAVFNPINMGASTVSVIIAGSLASTTLRTFHADVAGLHIGPIDTIFTVAALLIAVAGVFAAIALPRGIPSTGTEPIAAIEAGDEASVIEPAVVAITAEAEVLGLDAVAET